MRVQSAFWFRASEKQMLALDIQEHYDNEGIADFPTVPEFFHIVLLIVFTFMGLIFLPALPPLLFFGIADLIVLSDFISILNCAKKVRQGEFSIGKGKITGKLTRKYYDASEDRARLKYYLYINEVEFRVDTRSQYQQFNRGQEISLVLVGNRIVGYVL